MRRFLFWGALSATVLGSYPSSIADDDPATQNPASSPGATIPAALSSSTSTSSPSSEPARVAPSRNSISCGSANRGAIADPARLEPQGPGYLVPETWQKRGFSYGTDELVGMIRRAAASVDAQFPGSVLGVADLGKPGGGAAIGHRSHQSGRDVDLLYYARDEQDQLFPPDSLMPVYTSTGKAYYSEAPTWQKSIPVRYFDLARNWALIAAVLSDPEAKVSHIFVSQRIKRWLLDYATTIQADPGLIARARLVLSSPRNVKAHNDHLHLRIACPAADISAGRCQNDNAPRRKSGRWSSRITCPRPPPVP